MGGKRKGRRVNWKKIDKFVNYIILGFLVFGILVAGLVWLAIVMMVVGIYALQKN